MYIQPASSSLIIRDDDDMTIDGDKGCVEINLAAISTDFPRFARISTWANLIFTDIRVALNHGWRESLRDAQKCIASAGRYESWLRTWQIRQDWQRNLREMTRKRERVLKLLKSIFISNKANTLLYIYMRHFNIIKIKKENKRQLS